MQYYCYGAYYIIYYPNIMRENNDIFKMRPEHSSANYSRTL